MRIINLDNLNHAENLLLNEQALLIRKEYDEIINALSADHVNNIDWIVGSIASRNKYQSPLFYRCTQLAFLGQILTSEPTIIKSSDRPLCNLIESSFGIHHKVVCTEKVYSRLWRMFRPVRQYLIGFYFLALRIIARNKQIRADLFQKPVILIDTFVLNNAGDEGSITNGIYKDRYYPGLLENVTDTDRDRIFYLPTTIGFLNPIKIFKIIRSAKGNFILHDDFLRLNDYLFILTHPFRQLKLKLPEVLFRGIVLNPVLEQERRRNCSDFAALLGVLHYRFAFRLSQKQVKVQTLIEWYENQVIDRGMIKGFHEFLPNVPVVGYQGYIISKGLHLYTQPNRSEYIGGAVPDIVAVTGPGLADNIKEFCSEVNVCVAPGFRFQKVWRVRKFYPEGNKFSVLIGLPIGLDDCEQMLKASYEVFSNENKDVTVYVKPHPTFSIDRIKTLIDEQQLSRFQFVHGDFHDQLERVNLVITNASSVSLEAVAKGVPVIILAPRTGILQNPIPEDIPKQIWDVAYTTEEIRTLVNKFRVVTNTNLSLLQDLGKSIRDKYFEPVTFDNVRKFITAAHE